jgi:hypothetical protein
MFEDTIITEIFLDAIRTVGSIDETGKPIWYQINSFCYAAAREDFATDDEYTVAFNSLCAVYQATMDMSMSILCQDLTATG